MARPLKCNPDAVLADWKTGKFSERDLAAKHKVSPSTVHKLVAGVEKSIEALASKTVEIKQQVANLNEREKSNYEQLVEEKLLAKKFFDNAHMLTAKIAVMKLQSDKANASYQDLNAAANAITKAQEGVLGKAPTVAVQVNNNGGPAADTTVSAAPNRAARMQAVRELLDSRL
jgi:hypothetical protein